MVHPVYLKGDQQIDVPAEQLSVVRFKFGL